jgi:putative FmdB family regulatory protein
MPVYDYSCSCGYKEERYLGMGSPNPQCPTCKETMTKEIGSNIMVKIKGGGGFPSRRKQIFNTTNRIHPKLS